MREKEEERGRNTYKSTGPDTITKGTFFRCIEKAANGRRMNSCIEMRFLPRGF